MEGMGEIHYFIQETLELEYLYGLMLLKTFWNDTYCLHLYIGGSLGKHFVKIYLYSNSFILLHFKIIEWFLILNTYYILYSTIYL